MQASRTNQKEEEKEASRKLTCLSQLSTGAVILHRFFVIFNFVLVVVVVSVVIVLVPDTNAVAVVAAIEANTQVHLQCRRQVEFSTPSDAPLIEVAST